MKRSYMNYPLFFLFLFLPSILFSQINDIFEKDMQQLLNVSAQFTKLTEQIYQNKNIFSQSREKPFNLKEEKFIYQIWSSFLDYEIWLDLIKRKYMKSGFNLLLKDHKELSINYILSYLAFQTQFINGYKFIKQVENNHFFEILLDEEHKELHIKKDNFSRIKFFTLNYVNLTHLLASKECYGYVRSQLQKNNLLKNERVSKLDEIIRQNDSFIEKEIGLDFSKSTFTNGWDIIKTGTFKGWFPVQKEIALMMGHVKFKRQNKFLITEELLAEFSRKLLPGDILLERKNWYLSNVGLPGFWPHAELFIGDIDTIKSFFNDDPALNEWIHALNKDAVNFTSLLELTYPLKYKEYLQPKGKDINVIIEAVARGVSFSTMKEANSCDYLAAIRPKLSVLEKAKTIYQAFSHVNKPYDYDFDFASNNALVCTELVYKSYLPSKGKKGIPFAVVDVLDRPTLPANVIAEYFINNENDFTFVAFIDSLEKENKSFFSDYKSFKSSVDRSKWDFFLE